MPHICSGRTLRRNRTAVGAMEELWDESLFNDEVRNKGGGGKGSIGRKNKRKAPEGEPPPPPPPPPPQVRCLAINWSGDIM